MSGTRKPNIVLIAIDTLRADHLSCYGYSRGTSPRLDDLAREAVLFEECIAADIPTHPSFTSVFTGRGSHAHGVLSVGGKTEPPAEIPMLSEVLAQNGYRTLAADNLGRWMTRGFHTYNGYKWETQDRQARKAEAVNQTAMSLLREGCRGEEPFFLFIHYWDPHTPYLPPKPYDRLFYQKPPGTEKDPNNRSLIPCFAFDPFSGYFADWMGPVTDADWMVAQYDGEIAYCDREVGRLLDLLTFEGRQDDTIVIVYADHGEVMMEHVGYFDHHGLYNCNVHVPLIMRYPARFPAGKRVAPRVQQIDLMPTLLELCGLPPVAGIEGKSLLSLIDEDVAAQAGSAPHPGYDEVFLSEASWQLKRGVVNDQWKFIKALAQDFHGGPMRELYDLERDPDEQVNVVMMYPDIARDLESRLDAWLAERLRLCGKSRDPILEQGEPSLKRVGAGDPLAWKKLMEEQKKAQAQGRPA